VESFDGGLGKGGGEGRLAELSSDGMGSSGFWRRFLLASSCGVRSFFCSMSIRRFPTMMRPVSFDSYSSYMYP
jgi:hypothetical protein